MKNSKLCLAGFFCAILPILIYVLLKVMRLSNSLIGVIIGWIALISGIVLSLAGMIRDKKKKIGLGVAGITISILELIPWTFFSIIIFSLAAWEINYPVNNPGPTEPTTNIIETIEEAQET